MAKSTNKYLSPTRNDPEDLPIFRPRIGRRVETRSREPSFRNALLRGLRRSTAGGGRDHLPSNNTANAYGRFGRRVVVKAHYVRLAHGGAQAAALHLRYIQRDGVEKDGSRGVLYDANGPARSARFDEPRADERHQFRLILSPE